MKPIITRIANEWFAWMLQVGWQVVLLVAFIGILSYLTRNLSARFRYMLWVLVFVKIFIPPTVGFTWGVSEWTLKPFWNQVESKALPALSGAPETNAVPASPVQRTTGGTTTPATQSNLVPTLFTIWAAGGVLWIVLFAWKCDRTAALVRRGRRVDHGPLFDQLVDLCGRSNMAKKPVLILSDKVTSPFVTGLFQPYIVLPASLPEEIGAADMRNLLLHELIHCKQRDLVFVWIQFCAQTAMWFHPFVWFASKQLSHARECACDEIALGTVALEPKNYGETLLKVVLASEGRPSVAWGSTGVFERSTWLQNRLEEIMKFNKSKKRFSWGNKVVLLLLAALLLPMSYSKTAAQVAPKAKTPAGAVPMMMGAGRMAVSETPQIVATNPKVGASEVDPNIDEISVTFDQPMSSGFSWTGGGKYYPPSREGKNIRWVDEKTCVLPVKLEAGKFYRVGINSTSYNNFRSIKGRPALPSAIYFCTQGASEDILALLAKPRLVSLSPENNAEGVDPNTEEIRIEFNVPMGAGFSVTGGGANFPDHREGAKMHWSDDGKTLIFPVKLKPNWYYQMGVNSEHHINFQSAAGVPFEPVVYMFKTGQ